ncbi:hypothetical protein BGZ54_000194, partial [Gamsiella multidivaricata]
MTPASYTCTLNTDLTPSNPLFTSSSTSTSLSYSATYEALRLPDILLCLAPFLTHHDLYTCTLVSSVWHLTFNPCLWRAIAISESRHQPDFLSTLSTNLHWVHSLQWKYTEWWEYHHVSRERAPLSLATLPSLQQPQQGQRVRQPDMCRPFARRYPPPLGHPVYRAPSQISFPTTSTIQNLGFEHACSLRSLVLDGPFELTPLLTTLKQSSPMLRQLSLKNTNCMRREMVPMELLFKVSPSLEDCCIRTNAQFLTAASCGNKSATGAGDDVEEVEGCRMRSGYSLKSLELDARGLTSAQLWVLLLQCPNLESVTMIDYGQISPLEDFEALGSAAAQSVRENDACLFPQRPPQQSARSHGPPNHYSTNSYQRDSSNDSSNNSNNNVNIHCPNSLLLEQLPTFLHRGVESVRFGDVGLTALQYYCPQIKRLDLTQANMGKLQSRTVQQFLESATRLVHLRIKGMTLQVEDMVDPRTRTLVPWGCKSLETLSVAFGVAGPRDLQYYTSTVEADVVPEGLNREQGSAQSNDDSESDKANHAVWAERMVYRQLSLLTQLRVLDIRQSFLRLQLGTGIELLATLEKLKEFSIAGSGIDVEEGVSEAMDGWFGMHWPWVDKIVVASRACSVKTPGAVVSTSTPSFG